VFAIVISLWDRCPSKISQKFTSLTLTCNPTTLNLNEGLRIGGWLGSRVVSVLD